MPPASEGYSRQMDSGIAVALIAAVTGLLTSIYTLREQHKLDYLKLGREDKKSQREEIRQLDRHREPFLQAADDLRDRIYNIRKRHFLVVYLQNERRNRIALLSTFYRFGKYWAVVESLYTAIDVVRFARDEDTKAVSHLLVSIGKAFATDNAEKYGGHLMV